jgi:predicted RNA-binding protein Jag
VATQKTSPLDATGKAVEDAAKKNAAELRRRQDEITLIRQQEDELLSTAVFDPKKPDEPILLDEIEEVGVSVNDEKVIIRTITDIDDMTYGVGNTYSFKAGVKYSVTRDLADYLEGLGYIWRPN